MGAAGAAGAAGPGGLTGDVGRVGRVAVRVRPGASRTRVGGAHGDRLVVAVGARAVDGAATAAALDAIADAFGVRPRAVRLVTGATSRDKLVEIDLPAPEVAARAAALMSGGTPV